MKNFISIGSMDKPCLLDQMTIIQQNVLDFLNNEASSNEYSFLEYLDELKICDDKHNFRLFLKFLLTISKNHHRYLNFFSKIELILKKYKKEIQQYYSNTEIFNIFKKNKRILLFLINQKMLSMDNYIFNKFAYEYKYINAKYPQYFAPEIKPFLTENWINKYKQRRSDSEWIDEVKLDLPDNFEENRQKGENESYICQLIQNDSVEEFIKYVNKTNYSLNSKIELSIYETNSFLIKKSYSQSLINYAAFYGSIHIFQFLKFSGVDLNSSLWESTIHSNNPSLIHILEENSVMLKYETLISCLKQSIKCHHNEIAIYFIQNYMNNIIENLSGHINQAIKSYNFSFIKEEYVNNKFFSIFCRSDYYNIVELLMKDINLIINEFDEVQNQYF